jgi:hypothetical protein
MDYLLQHLIFYALFAFLIGVFVGWNTCSRIDDR